MSKKICADLKEQQTDAALANAEDLSNKIAKAVIKEFEPDQLKGIEENELNQNIKSAVLDFVRFTNTEKAKDLQKLSGGAYQPIAETEINDFASKLSHGKFDSLSSLLRSRNGGAIRHTMINFQRQIDYYAKMMDDPMEFRGDVIRGEALLNNMKMCNNWLNKSANKAYGGNWELRAGFDPSAQLIAEISKCRWREIKQGFISEKVWVESNDIRKSVENYMTQFDEAVIRIFTEVKEDLKETTTIDILDKYVRFLDPSQSGVAPGENPDTANRMIRMKVENLLAANEFKKYSNDHDKFIPMVDDVMSGLKSLQKKWNLINAGTEEGKLSKEELLADNNTLDNIVEMGGSSYPPLQRFLYKQGQRLSNMFEMIPEDLRTPEENRIIKLWGKDGTMEMRTNYFPSTKESDYITALNHDDVIGTRLGMDPTTLSERKVVYLTDGTLYFTSLMNNDARAYVQYFGSRAEYAQVRNININIDQNKDTLKKTNIYYYNAMKHYSDKMLSAYDKPIKPMSLYMTGYKDFWQGIITMGACGCIAESWLSNYLGAAQGLMLNDTFGVDGVPRLRKSFLVALDNKSNFNPARIIDSQYDIYYPPVKISNMMHEATQKFSFAFKEQNLLSTLKKTFSDGESFKAGMNRALDVLQRSAIGGAAITGASTAAGATAGDPLTGALWGAGVGLIFGSGRNLTSIGEFVVTHPFGILPRFKALRNFTFNWAEGDIMGTTEKAFAYNMVNNMLDMDPRVPSMSPEQKEKLIIEYIREIRPMTNDWLKNGTGEWSPENKPFWQWFPMKMAGNAAISEQQAVNEAANFAQITTGGLLSGLGVFKILIPLGWEISSRARYSIQNSIKSAIDGKDYTKLGKKNITSKGMSWVMVLHFLSLLYRKEMENQGKKALYVIGIDSSHPAESVVTSYGFLRALAAQHDYENEYDIKMDKAHYEATKDFYNYMLGPVFGKGGFRALRGEYVYDNPEKEKYYKGMLDELGTNIKKIASKCDFGLAYTKTICNGFFKQDPKDPYAFYTGLKKSADMPVIFNENTKLVNRTTAMLSVAKLITDYYATDDDRYLCGARTIVNNNVANAFKAGQIYLSDYEKYERFEYHYDNTKNLIDRMNKEEKYLKAKIESLGKYQDKDLKAFESQLKYIQNGLGALTGLNKGGAGNLTRWFMRSNSGIDWKLDKEEIEQNKRDQEILQTIKELENTYKTEVLPR